MREAAIHALVICDPRNAIHRMREFNPTASELQYASRLIRLLHGKTDRYVTPAIRAQAKKGL